MKKTILQLSSLLLLFIFASESLHAQEDHVSNLNDKFAFNPNADRDVNMVTDFMQAFLVDKDFDKARQYFKPDAIDYGPGYGDSANVDQMIQMQQKLDSTVTDWNIQYFVKFSVSVKEGDQQGDWVLLWGNVSSTNKSGKTITVPFNSVFKIEDEKIAMEVDYYDNMSIVKQLGYTITPPTEGQ